MSSGRSLELTLRTRDPKEGRKVKEAREIWDAQSTALIICDMWDRHWCQGATTRVKQLVPRVAETAALLRKLGVTVIHCPSGVTDFYKGAPAREKVGEVKIFKPPSPFSDRTRWGYPWCWPDADVEPELPIDDSDGGCFCAPECKQGEPWTRQHPGIPIYDEDWVTDDGQEAHNVLKSQKISKVILVGVHLNMCVLGRPFGARQLLKHEFKVIVLRDLTDTMYNPRSKPKVSHHEGTEMVVGHVEKYLCPTSTSGSLLGKNDFKFPSADNEADRTALRGSAEEKK
eukprot:CAMPEP_0184490574 /NCGR_PEP_ID=MMETSP0113_2-20130426/18222_1 /TAXON_ID=91329 /ORGANISM="Norrisiella sphaerica, Strain BC52" /LENGTH=284 /DNA_ID=CAMNT_0026874515 /DNA_START=290 /DNA_END=1144 /DNA_ORIENTATION=+